MIKKHDIDTLKYADHIRYTTKIIKNFYNQYENRFKGASMDLQDLKQEVFCKIMQEIVKYEKKFTDKKVDLWYHLRKSTEDKLNNILRDTKNEQIVMEFNEFRKEKKELNLYKNPVAELEALKEDKRNVKHTEEQVVYPKFSLNNEEIMELFKKYTVVEKELEVMRLRIIIGVMDFDRIGKELQISGQRAWFIFKKIIKRMKIDKNNLPEIW